jgi:predicted  nucleic acid-binding Zn-ribbon protein
LAVTTDPVVVADGGRGLGEGQSDRSKERELQEAKAELLRLQEEARRGELASRDVQDHTARMKTEISDLRQKSNSHAMEKLELQRTELVQMKQVCVGHTDRAVESVRSIPYSWLVSLVQSKRR